MRSALLSLAFFSTLSFLAAESDGWKSERIDGGTMTVKSRVTEKKAASGDSILIEYTATVVAPVGLAPCIALLLDGGKHKDIVDSGTSGVVKTISKSEVLLYYGFPAKGPFAAADCVAKMTWDIQPSMATFTLTAAPDQYEDKKVDRFSVYDLVYQFTDLGNGSTEIKTSAKMVPAMKVPAWMVRMAFPGAAGNSLKTIVKLAKALP